MFDVRQIEQHGTFKSYLFGFLLSLVLTLGTYFVVVEHLFVNWGLVFTILCLAFFQAIIQLLLFLHVGKEAKPKWKLLSFLFMAMVLAIIVIGSLWIMFNLDSRVMPHRENTNFWLHFF